MTSHENYSREPAVDERDVAAGEALLSPSITRRLIADCARRPPASERPQALPERIHASSRFSGSLRPDSPTPTSRGSSAVVLGEWLLPEEFIDLLPLNGRLPPRVELGEQLVVHAVKLRIVLQELDPGVLLDEEDQSGHS